MSALKDKIVINCSECKGTRKLEIRNAYDPEYVEYEDCPYCKPYYDYLHNLTENKTLLR